MARPKPKKSKRKTILELTQYLDSLEIALDCIDTIITTQRESLAGLPSEVASQLHCAQIREEILRNPVLRRYKRYPTDLLAEPEEVVLSRAKAHRVQLRAELGKIRAESFGFQLGSYFRAGAMKFLLPILVGISIPSAVAYVTSEKEVEAYKEQQAFLANYQMTKELVEKLSDIQAEGQRLQDNIFFQEREEGYIPSSSARQYQRRGNALLTRLQSVVDPIGMIEGSSVVKARASAELELDALIACLSVDYLDSGAEEKLLERQEVFDAEIRSDPQLTERQVASLLGEIRVQHPCGKEFDPFAFRELTYEVSRVLWEALGHNVFVDTLAVTSNETGRDR